MKIQVVTQPFLTSSKIINKNKKRRYIMVRRFNKRESHIKKNEQKGKKKLAN